MLNSLFRVGLNKKHFMMPLLFISLFSIVNIFQILQGMCQLMTSTVYCKIRPNSTDMAQCLFWVATLSLAYTSLWNFWSIFITTLPKLTPVLTQQILGKLNESVNESQRIILTEQNQMTRVTEETQNGDSIRWYFDAKAVWFYILFWCSLRVELSMALSSPEENYRMFRFTKFATGF